MKDRRNISHFIFLIRIGFVATQSVDTRCFIRETRAFLFTVAYKILQKLLQIRAASRGGSIELLQIFFAIFPVTLKIKPICMIVLARRSSGQKEIDF